MPDFNDIVPVLALSVTSPREGEMIASRRPRFEGMGEPFSRLHIVAYQNGRPQWGADWNRLGSGPNWSVQIEEWDLPTGTIDLEVHMFRDSDLLGKVNRQFFIAGAPKITSPARNALIINELRPEVSGEGSNGTVVTIYREGGGDGIYGSTSVINGRWQTRLSKDLPPGPFVFHAQALLDGLHTGWSNTVPVTVVVLAAPEITSPAQNSIQPLRPTVSGKGGYSGAQVEIYKDLASEQLGTASVGTTGDWSTTVTKDLPPGPYSIAVRQTFGGKQSQRSAPRGFKIRPPQLATINTEFLNTPVGSVKFSGAGHGGATVEITVVSGPGGTAPPAVQVSNGLWETTANNWPVGAYKLSAVQKVPDNANGWVLSQPYIFDVVRAVPPPTNVTYTVDGYTPIFTGNGYNGAMVVLFNPGGGSNVAPNARVSGGRWSSMAFEAWGPTWKRKVQLRQELGGQVSEGWVEIEVSIAPLAPVITDITGIDDGQHSPTFKGTCLSGARVTLRFSDNAQTHQATVAGNQWTFRRSTPFAADITHTVTVTQRAAEQDSPVATRAFSLERFIPQPVFTAPAAGSEVGRNLLVKGRGGIAGGKIELHDAQFSGLVGTSDSLITDGDWEVQLNNLAFRDFTLYAVQIMGGRTSERSAERSFKVVVLPPEIEVPAPDGALPRIARISGKGLPGARVDVWLQGVAEPILTGIWVDTNGLWQSEPVTLEIGRHSLRARQTFEGRASKDTPAQAFRVVPLAPAIETPVDAAPVGRGVVVSGFGYPGDTVAVALSTAPQTVLGRAPVFADRTWSVAVELVVASGDHDLIAIASSGEFDSGASLPRKVRVGPYLPSIDVPAPSRWVTDPVAFAGKGQPGVGELVSWFDPGRVVARDIPVTANGWQSDATIRLPQGGYWVRFRQVIGSGGSVIHSDWADSRRFEVVPSPPGISQY